MKISGLKRSILLLMIIFGITGPFLLSEGADPAVSDDFIALSSLDDGTGPLIQNTSFEPASITTSTESVLVRASIADPDGISAARVYACLTNASGFQLLCLPPHEMAAQGDAWEATVQILFVTVIGDYVGFNITAQDGLGSSSSYYTMKIVEEPSNIENTDTSGTTTNETDLGIWEPFLGLVAAVFGFKRIRQKQKKPD
ncbi:MAG: hypothetical protein ACFFGZ_02685 [Candidatus Thorarchaeota archaeon]